MKTQKLKISPAYLKSGDRFIRAGKEVVFLGVSSTCPEGFRAQIQRVDDGTVISGYFANYTTVELLNDNPGPCS